MPQKKKFNYLTLWIKNREVAEVTAASLFVFMTAFYFYGTMTENKRFFKYSIKNIKYIALILSLRRTGCCGLAWTVIRRIKKKPRQKKKRVRLSFWNENYSCSGAPTGQVSAQAPHSMQVSGSITYLPSPSEIAPTGHAPAQAPQAMHSSLIL